MAESVASLVERIRFILDGECRNSVARDRVLASIVRVIEEEREAASRLSSPEGTRGPSEKAYQLQAVIDDLELLNRTGGLGLDVHERLRSDVAMLKMALSSPSSAPAATPARCEAIYHGPADIVERCDLPLGHEQTHRADRYKERGASFQWPHGMTASPRVSAATPAHPNCKECGKPILSADDRWDTCGSCADKLEASPRVSAATPTRDELLGESMNRGLRHELLRQEADRQGKSLCLVRSPKGEWQLGYGEAAADLDWLGHGSTPDKAIQNALETDTVLKALAEDIPWQNT